MATVWKHPESKYWFAKITLPDGRRTSRTTKQTERKAAVKAAEAMEVVAALARRNELTQSAVVKLAQDLAVQIGAAPIKRQTISGHCLGYLDSGKAEWSEGTLNRYTPVIHGFLAHIGETRGAASLASLTAGEIESFRTAEIKSGKGPSTANFAVKVLRGVFSGPTRRGEIPINPATAVELPKAKQQEREPFLPEELKSMLKVTKGTDWEGMIYFGGHCGVRLADGAHLLGTNLDMKFGILKFKQTKTGDEVAIAMHPELFAWLKKRKVPTDTSPIFPTLVHNKTGSAGGLSNAFSAIMKKAGVEVPIGEKRTGRGRTFRAKGFHSLRHTMVSRMANEDVPADVRRAIAGHASDAAHERYVHLKVDTQRRAVKKMPKLAG